MDVDRINQQFVKNGWIKARLADDGGIHAARALILDRLRDRWTPTLERIEDYHRFVDDDDRHVEIQHDLCETYWQAGLGRRIIADNIALFRALVGPDLNVQTYPYLRIARPGKRQDNIGFHRDTYYGSSPFELSVHIPFMNLDADSAMSVLSGSHVAPDSDFPYRQEQDASVPKSSVKHQLGFLYAPKHLDPTVCERVTPVPMELGEALVFALSMVHGQEVNHGRHSRFTSDIRVVNAHAPVEWSRTVRDDYYQPLVVSAVTEVARAYERANRAGAETRSAE